MPLESQTAAILANIEAQGLPALNELSVADARAMMVAGIPDLPQVEVGSVENRTIDGTPYSADIPIDGVSNNEEGASKNIPIRIYRPVATFSANPSSANGINEDKKRPVHIYFHGGGWVLGDLDTHDRICRELCALADVIVVSVAYRLAPENPFPAGLQDAFAALCWVSDNLTQLGARQDKKALSVGGDSAGATLAAGVCILARDQGKQDLQNISFQLLCYPVADASMSCQSYQSNGEGYLLSKKMMEWFWGYYCPQATAKAHPLASILNASDLSNLPPTLLLTAEYDPLRDEGEQYAERLSEAGVSVKMNRLDGLIHGFMSQVGYIPATRAGLDMAVAALKEAHSIS